MNIMPNYIPPDLILEKVQKSIKSPLVKSSASEENGSKEDVKKIAREMEALFIHELIKVMRKTADSASSEDHGLGKDTYMDLFDMELSRVMAGRGFGLQKALENFLDKKIEQHDKVNTRTNDK